MRRRRTARVSASKTTVLTVVLTAGIASVLLTRAGLGAGLESTGAATDPVVAMSQSLYPRVNPRTSVNLVTPSAGEATKAATTSSIGAPGSGTPAPAAQAPAAQAPAPPSGSSGAKDAGAAPVGSAAYPVPAGAVFVSPGGDDAGPGQEAAPLETLDRALAVVPDGGTVVLRAGLYHETVTIAGKTVTVQNYPGEAVWLDGSVPVSGWVADGGRWRRDGWTTRFDSSPTYTPGAPDGTAEGWQFVNTRSYPMAAHPDQVFVDGRALRQVSGRDQVTAGTFFLDTATSGLYLGTDPDGHRVAASTLIKAMTIRGAGSVIRGIGIRRYSPSVFHVGAVTVEAPGVRLENVVVTDSATTGISVQKPDVTLDHVTVERAGMLGIQSRHADRETLSSVLVRNNNVEHFNTAPNAGGVKITSTRGIRVSGSIISGNAGHGFWEDMSCYDTVIRGSEFTDNTGDGVFLEISAKAVVGDNFISGNTGFGIKINNTSDVQVWNNTFTRNGRALNLVQDSRRNTDRSDPAVDDRVSWPDPAMPWTLGPVTVRNNVVADPNTAANCLLCVEDYSRTASAEQLGITADADVYHRRSASSPTWLAVWSRANVNVNPHTFTSLSSLVSTTGQEKQGREYVGPPIVDAAGRLTPSVRSATSALAEPLPADVASALGRPAGSKHVGTWGVA